MYIYIYMYLLYVCIYLSIHVFKNVFRYRFPQWIIEFAEKCQGCYVIVNISCTQICMYVYIYEYIGF